MLKFEVVNQKIKRIDNFEVVSDSKNYLKAHFTFSDEWKGDITAIFGHGDKYYTVLLESGECTVPWEVIKPYGFSVSVVCGDRITSSCEVVIVEKSGYIEGETPKAPTPDVYKQILDSVKPPYIGDNGNWFEWDTEAKTFVDTGVKAQGGVPKQYISEYIDKQTAVIKSDIEGLQKHINEESHFRGYLSTNAKIQAMEATPNDFAYSAESGTKWIYDAENGWQDSGTPVPDQLTPASEAAPLMNGVATAGTEETYARGDHRHPTDTTRASVEDLNNLKNSIKPFEVHITENSTGELRADKTFSEIIEAYNSGITNIVALHQGVVLPLLGFDSSFIVWSVIVSTDGEIGAATVMLGVDDSIVIHIPYCENIDNKVTSIANEPTNLQYPTAKAVKDYVDDRLAGQSAEIEEAIDRITAIQNTLIGGDA